MSDLGLPLAAAVRDLIDRKKRKFGSLQNLVNEIIHEETDFEHVITFLDQSSSTVHRDFAGELRAIFARVLKRELKAINGEVGELRYALYSALLDMYRVNGCPEELGGILSINYDEYVEAAARDVYGEAVDYGIAASEDRPGDRAVRLLKLHGSFNWRDTWPVVIDNRGTATPLWIPPGIQKAKESYPFGLLWGLAREMLNCDVLRIVGCRLSGNDWDLISLLFATRHAHVGRHRPYNVEIIDCPMQAFKLKGEYPYLGVRSVFEIEDLGVGAQLVSEVLGGAPRPFADLTDEEQQRAAGIGNEGTNWFRLWLEQMAEAFVRELAEGSVDTPSGAFSRILEET